MEMSRALLVTDDKYDVDLFLELVAVPRVFLPHSQTLNCNFQGRFLFDTDEDKQELQTWG